MVTLKGGGFQANIDSFSFKISEDIYNQIIWGVKEIEKELV